MLFRTHEKNIPQIKACVAAYGEIWVHGSGDIFPVYHYDPAKPEEQDHSKNHAENFNKGYEENSYRVKINALNMPKSKAELDRLLRAAKDQEEILKRAPSRDGGRVKNITVTDDDVYEPAGEVDLSAYARNQENVPAKRGRKAKEE